MPDIFGRNPEDYQHIRALQEAGVWERHEQALGLARGGLIPPHDFNALGAGIPQAYMREEPNAQAIGYLTNNLLAIQSMADEILYTEHRLPDFVPLNTGIAEGADTYAVRVNDYVGEGEFITNDGSDAPNATASQRLVPHSLHYAGIDATWTVEDLRNAAFTGFPLDTESLQAAVRGAMNHMERVGLLGDTKINAKGLTNLTTGTGGVNLQTQASNMTFDDLSSAQMRDLINDDISWVIEQSEETLGGGWGGNGIDDGLCVYLPTQQYNRLVSRFIGDDEDRSVMRAILEDNPWTHRTSNPVMFKSMKELAGAGASTNTDRMVTAVKNMRVFEMGVSISPRVLRILDKGRVINAQVEYKFGSLFVKRPTIMRYRDAI